MQGLRAEQNPFRTGRIGAIAFRPQGGADWDALMARFEALGRRGAFTGPMGSGKTAALDELARRLQAAGWRVVRLRIETGRRWMAREVWREAFAPASGPGPRDAVLLDSAEQLCAAAWLGFRWRTRRAGAIAIATHEPGRLPTLHACSTSPALLGELAGELLAPAPAPPPAALETLWRRHSGNLRHAFLELYDRCASGETDP